MSRPGRPEGEYRRARPEGTPVSVERPFRERSSPLGGTARRVKGAR